jgi:hypothetical protein
MKRQEEEASDEIVATSALRQQRLGGESMSNGKESKAMDMDARDAKDDQSLSQHQDDTASIGDLMSVFGSYTLRNELLVQPKDVASGKPSEELPSIEVSESLLKSDEAPTSAIKKAAAKTDFDRKVDTSIVVDEEGDTASLADLSEITVCHKAATSSNANGMVTGSNASISEGSSKKTLSESKSAPTETPKSSVYKTKPPESVQEEYPLSPTQSEGDTASLGDLSSVFLGSRGTTSASSFSSSISLYPVESPKQEAPSPESTNSDTPTQQSTTAFTSSDDNDAATCGDLADILELATSPMDVDSPLSSNAGNVQTFDFINTNSSGVSRKSQRLGGFSENSEIVSEAQEAASMPDLAEMIGCVSSQSQARSPSVTPADKAVVRDSDKRQELSSTQSSASTAAATSVFQGPVKGAISAIAEYHESRFEEIAASASRKRSRSPLSSSLKGTSTSTELTPEMRLTPNSHKKPTPTKLATSPRRVVNPKSPNSPARNTRSAKKAVLQQQEADERFNQEVTSKNRRSSMWATENKENNEVKDANFRTVEPLDDANTSNRRKSSILGAPKESAATTAVQSPAPKKHHPVGILSSRKKLRSAMKSSQRSVAFGSPEAAEYHVGSPSMSMTPMPASKAKALFSIPKNDSSGEASDLSYDGGDQTVEIEADLNVLVDKITVENMNSSPALSPIASGLEYTVPVVLPGNYCLSSTSRTKPAPSISKSSFNDESTMSHTREDEQTVELEGGIEGLLQNIGTRKKRKTPTTASETDATNPEHSPTDSSVEMTDAQSIASVNSAKSDKFTSKFKLDAQKLSFSPSRAHLNHCALEDESMDIDEGDTVELENGMTGLLAAAGVRDILAGVGTITSAAENGRPPTALPADRIQKAPWGTTSPKESDISVASKRSRRSSLTRRRFSLVPADGVEVSMDGSIKIHENSFISERSVSFLSPVTTEIRASTALSHETVTLTFEEILETVAIDPDALKPKRSLHEGDLVVRFNSTANVGNDLAFHRWNHFIHAVCGEVERRTDNDGTAAEALASTFEEQPERFGTLQRQLRSKENDNLTELLQSLLTEGRKAIAAEWNMWLGSVMESFSNPLTEVVGESSDELAFSKEISEEYERVQHLISMISTKKIQRARRKSLVRRKVRSA